MMRNLFLLGILSLSVFAKGQPLPAAEHDMLVCKVEAGRSLDETIEACEKAIYDHLRPDKTETAEDLQKALDEYLADLERTSRTALDRAMLPVVNVATAAGTSKTDFASLFSVLVSSGSLTDDGESFTIDFGEAIGLPSQMRVVASLRPAGVYAPLKMVIEEAGMESALMGIEEGLDDFSDVSLEIKISPKKMGTPRGESWIDQVYFDIRESPRKALKKLRAKHGAAKNERDDWIADQPNASISSALSEESARALIPLVETVARANSAYLSKLDALLKEGQFFRFGELVANQPQWVVELELIERDAVAGCDEVRGAVSYEIGFPNLRGFRKKCATRSDLGACYDELFLDAGPKVEKGNRASIKVEYADLTTDAFMLPDSDVGIVAATDESFTVAVSYGRNLDFDIEKGIVTRRLELTADHEETDKESVRNTRQKAALTLTQRLTDETSLAFGVVWASDPEFRDEVDKALTASFGLSYKFTGAKKDESKKN